MDINLNAPINKLGYGVASHNFLKCLDKLGHSVSLFPMSDNIDCSQEEIPLIKKCILNAESFNWNAPSVKIWHQYGFFERIGKGLHVGMPIFELDTFTDKELRSLQSLDLCLVNSEWAAGILQKYKMGQKTRVVPLGVDTEIFYPPAVENTGTVKFFNAGKWEVRKGHDILQIAFNKAFEQEDDVELHLLCNNPFPQVKNEEWEQYYLTSKLGNKIRIVPRLDNAIDVANYMRKMDCGVFPSRGEGWNLELLEMMACGKHVIATDYSAHTEFCDDQNCWLIDITDKELAYDGIWFHAQGNWAKITDYEIDQLIGFMRTAYETISDGYRTNKKCIKTGKDFSWMNATKEMVSILEEYNE